MKNVLILNPYISTLGGGEKTMGYFCKSLEEYYNYDVNIDILVLDASGCCIFCNSPYMMAEMYKEILKEFTYFFRKIEISVYCTLTDQENYEIFSSIWK